MKFSKNRIAAIAIAIFLTVSMSASIILVPTANAHTPAWQITTYAYVQAVPNPVGAGQSAYIYMWLDKTLDGAAIGNDVRFHNYKLTITAPDGTTTTQTWAVCSDPTSSQSYSFTPTQVGTYTLNFTFPGQTYTWTEPHAGFFGPPAPSNYINDTFLPSTASTTLAVQQAPISTYPNSYPLPTEYWTRPIYGENPGWWSISSNWLGSTSGTNQGYGSDFPGDAVGPQTSHVMWTKPLQSGGVVGGNNFAIQGDTYFEGSAYNNKYTNPIILDGKLFYTEPVSFGGVTSGPTDCVDLRTGQLIWSRTDVPALSFGYIYDVQDPNQHGVYPPILFASTGGGFFSFGPATWRAFDADTGDPMFNVTNIPTGTSAIGVNGEYLIYVLANDGTPTNPQYYLGQWNSSNLWYGQYSGASTSPTVVPPITDGADPRMYDWNISIPSLNSMPASTILDAFCNNMLICMSGSYPSGGSAFSTPSSAPYTYFAVNLNSSKGAVGSILWTNTVNAPAGNMTVSFSGADSTAAVFVENYKETMQFVGYSMNTGQKLWSTDGNQVVLNYYSSGYNAGGNEAGAAYAYGKLYCGGMGGLLYCYDLTNGKLLWTYGNGGEGNSTSSGFEVPGNYPISIYAIGNGIVYTTVTEHTVSTPIYKGGLTRAINATDGTEVWTLSSVTEESGAPGTGAIADGYATFLNGYDNQIYVVGRGPSATTVTASPKVSTYGGNVLIEGTVTDISAGTTQTEQAADFPNGVPCASDASMKDWMGYVYQQKPLPTNFTGVPVTISVLDSNNNFRSIGSATTDATGHYSLVWTPDIPGNFTVVASFAGTQGYWSSNAETAFNIMNAPAATSAPTPTPASAADLYFVPLSVGMIVAIVIIGALLAILILRKRP